MSAAHPSMSQYEFSSAQAAAMAGPRNVEAYFAEHPEVYTAHGSSNKQPHGTNSQELASVAAAERHMWNPNAHIGLDCSAANMHAARPDGQSSVGSACHVSNPGFEAAMREMNGDYKVGGPGAQEVVRAEWELLYHPSRYVDVNGVAMAPPDASFGPDLMGAPADNSMECVAGESTAYCTLNMNPLPSNVQSSFWDGHYLDSAPVQGCGQLNSEESTTSACAASVHSRKGMKQSKTKELM